MFTELIELLEIYFLTIMQRGSEDRVQYTHKWHWRLKVDTEKSGWRWQRISCHQKAVDRPTVPHKSKLYLSTPGLRYVTEKQAVGGWHRGHLIHMADSGGWSYHGTTASHQQRHVHFLKSLWQLSGPRVCQHQHSSAMASFALPLHSMPTSTRTFTCVLGPHNTPVR